MPVFEVTNANEMSSLISILSKEYENTQNRAIVFMRGLDNLFEEGRTNGELTNQILSTLNETSKKEFLWYFQQNAQKIFQKQF